METKCERCGEQSWGKSVCFSCRRKSGEYNAHAAGARFNARLAKAFTAEGQAENAIRAEEAVVNHSRMV